jgi:flagellar biosynthesis protein FlhF
MVVRKFCASSAREALRQVREALGPNAMILSNRSTSAGVEIMAVSESEVTAVTAGTAPREVTAWPAQPHPVQPAPLGPDSPQSDTPAAVAASAAEPAGYNLLQEVRILRSILEGQLAAFAWRDLAGREPAKIEVLRQLLAAGFSAGSARQWVDQIAPGLDASSALRLVKTRLQQQLPVVPAGETPVERGGVYALVGPTGVGKTTTVAKLAAGCTLKLGAQRVALVTIDSYRIGAVDQLRIYGEILGVPVFPITTEADLALTLSELRTRHLVLIDTVGMSQRDRRITEQIALLTGNGARRVCRCSRGKPNVLEGVVKATVEGLNSSILTKVDETRLSAASDVHRHAAPPHRTNARGQKEDLHRPPLLSSISLPCRLRTLAQGRPRPTTRSCKAAAAGDGPSGDSSWFAAMTEAR